jgi:putative transposase
MRKRKLSDERVVGILAQEAAGTIRGTEVCRKHGIGRRTLQRWKAKVGGLGVSEMRRVKSLEDENRRRKRGWASRLWTFRR